MHEINPQIVKQRGGEGFRLRWYSDENHDLYVWLSDAGRLMRFQLCYDKGSPREQVVRLHRFFIHVYIMIPEEDLLRSRNHCSKPRDAQASFFTLDFAVCFKYFRIDHSERFEFLVLLRSR